MWQTDTNLTVELPSSSTRGRRQQIALKYYTPLSQTTGCNIPEDHNLNTHHCGYLGSQTASLLQRLFSPLSNDAED
jgi:hypothetical protein